MNPPRIALLTGCSDTARTGLLRAQAAFLAAVTLPDRVAVQDGYPWIGGLPEEPVPLPLAAWRNASQWRAARTALREPRSRRACARWQAAPWP